MEKSLFDNAHQGVVVEVERLRALLPESDEYYEKKYRKAFEKQARFMGNGVYQWAGIYSNDTQLLWLRGICGIEGIQYEDETDTCADCSVSYPMDDLESTMGDYVCRDCLNERYENDPDYADR
jgi:hypothetical protein